MNIRLKWLRDKLNALNIQGMIVSNPLSIKYLTNIDAEGELLITRKENVFITDGRYIEEVNTSLTIDDGVVVYDRRNMIKEDYENYFMFCENVGFEEDYITYAKYKEYMHMYKINNFVETDNFIKTHRACLMNSKRILSFSKSQKEVVFDNGMTSDLISTRFNKELI